MIALLFVTSVALFWAIQSSVLNSASGLVSNESRDGQEMLHKAEGYLDNGIINYLRNDNYAGESLQDGSFSCTISLSSIAGGKNLTSACGKNGRTRTVTADVHVSSSIYTVSKITEK